jgi:hypothetical protein
MTPQQVVGVAMRLVSLWLALKVIGYLSALPAALESANVAGGPAASYFVAGAYSVTAIVLWLFPMSIAHALVPRTAHDNMLHLQGVQLARVGCALIGLVVFVKALPLLVWLLLKAFLFAGTGSLASAMTADTKLEVALAVLDLVIGAALVLRASWFASLIDPEAADSEAVGAAERQP